MLEPKYDVKTGIWWGISTDSMHKLHPKWGTEEKQEEKKIENITGKRALQREEGNAQLEIKMTGKMMKDGANRMHSWKEKS